MYDDLTAVITFWGLPRVNIHDKSNTRKNTNFGIFLGKFLQLIRSLHYLPHVLHATFTQQLLQRDTCDDWSMEQVLVRWVHGTSFSGA